MAVVERTTETVAASPRISTHGRVVWRWMTTTDHKVIGNLYFISSFIFFMIGGLLALLDLADDPVGWPRELPDVDESTLP